MCQFIINHTRKHVYSLDNWQDTFDDVMDKNPQWRTTDNIDYQDDNSEYIGSLLKQQYTTNLTVHDLPHYTQDPAFLIWYMNSLGFNVYDITRAINVWEGRPEFEVAQNCIEELMEWKKDNEENDEDMLCDMMSRVM
jgi:hypothetical protein